MVSKENLQVMRCFLAAEWGKPQGNMSSLEIEKFILEAENKVLKIPPPELIEKVRTMLVQDHKKFCRQIAWRWDHREIFMKEFGPWCRVDGLPLEACKHSVVETAAFIRNNPHELPPRLRDRENSNDKYIKCVDKLQSIARMADFIRSRELLSIIVAESEQRGRDEKGCDKRRYSSEDGSHRAVVLALAGHETVSAWVGNPLGGMVKE